MSNKGRAVLVALAICGMVHAQEYEIRLTRQDRVGQVYDLTASGEMTEQETVISAGRVIESRRRSLSGTLEARGTVLAVDRHGRPCRVKLVVSRCELSPAVGQPVEVFPKGTEIVAEVEDGGQTYTVGGTEVSEQAGELLDLLISLPTSDVTDDEVFGTKEKKKIGDSWEINRAVAAKELGVKPEQVSGATRVETMVVVDGIPCLRLSATMEAEESGRVLRGLPVENSVTSFRFSGEFPIDTSLGVLSETARIQGEEIARKKDPTGSDLTIIRRSDLVSRSQMRYVR